MSGATESKQDKSDKPKLDGRVLDRLRKDLGLTQAQLAKAAKVDDSTIERWCGNVCNFRENDSFQLLIEFLNEKRRLKGFSLITREMLIYQKRKGLTASECFGEFRDWCQSRRKADTMRIHMIALSLSYAWEGIRNALKEGILSPNTSIDVCVLSDRPRVGSASACVARAVTGWAKAASGYCDNALDVVRSYTGNKSIRLAIRRYKGVPTWHGMRAETDRSTLYCVTTCYTYEDVLDDYLWGEGEFMTLSFENSTPKKDACCEAFDEQFSRHWNSSKSTEQTATGGSTAVD